MSWNFDAVGTPEAIVAEIDKHGEGYTGYSKEEFDLARPHLKGLIALNSHVGAPVVLEVHAAGHASRAADGQTTYSNCSVSIKGLGAKLVSG